MASSPPEIFSKPPVMIEIKVLMNSAIEEVLSFKCCNLHGLNMEIHLKNLDSEPVTVPNVCELLDAEGEKLRINNLYPVGPYTLPPGESLACYSSLPEEMFTRYQWIIFRDTLNREHRAPVSQSG